MLVTLFLPTVGGVSADEETYTAHSLILFGVASGTLILVWMRPTWAWLPALAWLAYVAWQSVDALEMNEFLRHLDPDAYLSPWPYLTASVGGVCVLANSLLEWRRSRVKTDVSAFD